MTAPTPGKERGPPPPPPPTVPSRPPPRPFPAPLAPRAREPRAPAGAALCALSSGLARRSRPSEKLAPSPGPDLALAARSAPWLACQRGLGCWRTREPSLRAAGGLERGGSCLSRSHSPLPGRAGVWGTPLREVARVRAPPDPGSSASRRAPAGLGGGADRRAWGRGRS